MVGILLLIRVIGYSIVEMFIEVGIHCCLSILFKHTGEGRGLANGG